MVVERFARTFHIPQLLLKVEPRLQETLSEHYRAQGERAAAIRSRITVIKTKITGISGKQVCSDSHVERSSIIPSRSDLHRIGFNFEKILLKSVTRTIFVRCTIDHLSKGYKQEGGKALRHIFVQFQSVRFSPLLEASKCVLLQGVWKVYGTFFAILVSTAIRAIQ